MKIAVLDLPRLVERMHRRFLDVLGVELAKHGVQDLNPAQAFLLLDIGEGELGVQELINRGYYARSNALYNIKKLVETGYFEESRSPSDRRVVRVKLTTKARDICTKLRDKQQELTEAFVRGDERPDDLEVAYRALRRLERAWDEYLRYGKL